LRRSAPGNDGIRATECGQHREAVEFRELTASGECCLLKRDNARRDGQLKVFFRYREAPRGWRVERNH